MTVAAGIPPGSLQSTDDLLQFAAPARSGECHLRGDSFAKNRQRGRLLATVDTGVEGDQFHRFESTHPAPSARRR